MNTHTNHVGTIKKLAFTILALSLAACGGGSSGDGSAVATSSGSSSSISTPSSSSSSSSSTSSTPASTTASFKAFSSIGPTSAVSMTFTTTSGVTSVTGANLSSTTTVTAFDAKGNATSINGGFTRIVAFGGDLAGQTCDNVAGHAYYSFVASGATEVPASELIGKSFTTYENCAALNDKSTFNADGSVTNVQGGVTEIAPASLVAATFGSGSTVDGVLSKATAYKATVNGTTFYAIVLNGRKVGSESTTGFTDIMVPVQ